MKRMVNSPDGRLRVRQMALNKSKKITVFMVLQDRKKTSGSVCMMIHFCQNIFLLS